MKRILIFLFFMYSMGLVGQVTLVGIGKINGKSAEIEIGEGENKIVLSQRKGNNFLVMNHQNNLYSIHKENGYVLKDSVGNELLVISKNGKYLEEKTGERYSFKKCKKWRICLIDKDDNIIAKAKYKHKSSKQSFEIYMNEFDPLLSSMILCKLVVEKRAEDENSAMFFLPAF